MRSRAASRSPRSIAARACWGEVLDCTAVGVDQPGEIAGEPALELARAGGCGRRRRLVARPWPAIWHTASHGSAGDRAADAAGHQRADDHSDDEAACPCTPPSSDPAGPRTMPDRRPPAAAPAKRRRPQPGAGTRSRSPRGTGGANREREQHAGDVGGLHLGHVQSEVADRQPGREQGAQRQRPQAEAPAAGRADRARPCRAARANHPKSSEREHVLARLDRVLSRGAEAQRAGERDDDEAGHRAGERDEQVDADPRQAPRHPPQTRVAMRRWRWGIITGSGTYSLPGFEGSGPEPVTTMWGDAFVSRGTFAGVEVLHISRHEEGHVRLSNHVTHQANLAALGQLGATGVLAVTVCGAVDPGVELGTLICFDDLHFLANRLPDGSPVHLPPGRGPPRAWPLDLRGPVLACAALRAAGGRHGGGPDHARRRLLRPRRRPALQHQGGDPWARGGGRHRRVADRRARRPCSPARPSCRSR